MDQYLNKKYKLAKSENFDQFLSTLGMGYLLRKMISTASPVLELKRDGDVYTLTSTTMIRAVTISFKLGEEFEEIKPDGTKVLNTITIEDNKLVQKQKYKDKEITLIKEFTDTTLTDVISVDDIVCTRTHTLVAA